MRQEVRRQRARSPPQRRGELVRRLRPAATARISPAAARPARSAPRSRGPPRFERQPASARAACRQRPSAPGAAPRRAAGSATKKATAIEPPADRAGLGQRRHQPVGEQPRAGAGHRAVDRPEQRAVAAPDSVRSSSRLARVAGSMNSVEPASSRSGQRERRPLGFLRLLDIGDDARDRRQLGAGKGAEAVGRGDAEEAGDAAGGAAESNRLGGCGLATRPSCVEQGLERRDRGTPARRRSAPADRPGRCRQRAAPASVSATRKTPVDISIQASA